MKAWIKVCPATKAKVNAWEACMLCPSRRITRWMQTHPEARDEFPLCSLTAGGVE